MLGRLLRRLQSSTVTWPLALFGIWWLLLQGFAVAAAQRVDLVPPDGAYAWIGGTDATKTSDRPDWLALHVRWDSGFYIWIAESGYQHDNAAFLPLYPLCIRVATAAWSMLANVAPTDATYQSLGILISNVSAVGAALVLYRLARLDFDDAEARHALFYFLIFPTAFFLTTVYTEPLFLLGAVMSFYFARRHHWWLAGLVG